jgi:hypothetical protein
MFMTSCRAASGATPDEEQALDAARPPNPKLPRSWGFSFSSLFHLRLFGSRVTGLRLHRSQGYGILQVFQKRKS